MTDVTWGIHGIIYSPNSSSGLHCSSFSELLIQSLIVFYHNSVLDSVICLISYSINYILSNINYILSD